MRERIFELLRQTTKPYRYVGGEEGSIKKDLTKIELKTCLMFPDMYEVAISNLGHRILYNILNKDEKILCDRTYAPAVDFAQILQKEKVLLYSSDNFIPLNEFDVIAVSLSYELSYPTMLKMFEMGGISVKSADRNENEPIVVGGGSCAYSPEPLWEFIDAFSIGDGEKSLYQIHEKILELKKMGKTRREIINALAKLEGVYVPSLYDVEGEFACPKPISDAPETVNKQNVNLDDDDFPTNFPVPLSPSVHDRVVVEIRRGCGRMCRFCQACFVNLPIRERKASSVQNLVEKSIENTGYEEYSLLSLSSNDYNGIIPLLGCITTKFADDGISVSLPSQRADKFSLKLAQLAQTVRKGTITIAIEAGSQRLRDVVNKNLNEEQIFSSILSAYEAGWNTVKIYLMIGLPTETYEDLDETIELLRRIKWRANNLRNEKGIKKLLNITATVSIFVPKSFTPFQWCAQNSLEEIKAKTQYLQEKVKSVKGVKLNFHNAFLSRIEAVFSRGDRGLSKFIYQTYKNGSYLDAWHENFNEEVWVKSAQEANIDFEIYSTRQIPIEQELPWDFIKTGVTKEFLQNEYIASTENLLHPACDEKCVRCGACGFGGVKKTINKEMLPFDENASVYNYKKEHEERKIYKYRLKLTKDGALQFISHLDFLKLVIKAIKKAHIDVAYSLGFNPSPKLSLGVALPLFVKSVGEVMDIELYENTEPEILKNKLNEFLHEGCRVVAAKRMPDRHEAIEVEAHWATYEAKLLKKNLKKNEIESIIKHVLDQSCILIERTNKKGLTKQVDIRKSIESIELLPDSDSIKIRFVLKATNSNSPDESIPILRADDFISLVFPETAWDVVRLELLDAKKESLLKF